MITGVLIEMATMAMMVGVLMAMMKTMTVKLSGVSMSRLLTDADTEAMVQRVQPEERDEVELFSFLLFPFSFEYIFF